jgi:hypothetical protein
MEFMFDLGQYQEWADVAFRRPLSDGPIFHGECLDQTVQFYARCYGWEGPLVMVARDSDDWDACQNAARKASKWLNTHVLPKRNDLRGLAFRYVDDDEPYIWGLFPSL